jgi:ABC-type thiamine transport system ATPase subunit
MTGLVLKDIRKSYGAVDVIHGIDLDIKQGEFIVFVGPSGCGKSTLLRMIAGLEEISGGEMTIDGERVNDVPPSKRGIAMVFQSYALYPHMTVYDNMAFGMRIAGESKEEIDRRVRSAPISSSSQISRPTAQGALRRPASARRHRPRHLPQSESLPVRRAAVQSRRCAARRDAHRDRQAQRADGRHDDDLRHA